MRLDETREFSELDWQSLVNQIEDLRAEARRLESASAELAKLTAALESVGQRIDADQEGALRNSAGWAAGRAR